MELWKSEQYAIKKLKEYNLYKLGWRFKFNRRQRANGLCDYRKRTIELSRILTVKRSDDDVINTILHELAHALTPYKGHGVEWKKKCLELGAKPERLSRNTVKRDLSEYTHIYQCKSCGEKFGTYRKLKNIEYRYHAPCKNNEYSGQLEQLK